MRLILALSVIVSHMFPAFGGKMEDREVLIRLTGGQMDLGALAVNSFFVISGFLITLSWLRTPNIKTFLAKRILRIYPGFILASLISLLIFAPLAGAKYSVAFAPVESIKSIGRMLFLSAPRAVGAFHGDRWDMLNLSLWTIRYEFICYLLVPLILLLFVRHARIAIAVLFAALLVWHGSQGKYLVEDGLQLPLIGSLSIWPKFLAYFVGGMFFAINRDRLPFRHAIAAICFLILILTAIFGGFFIAMASAGVYLIFYLAYLRNAPTFGIGDRVDLSYGTYLYGWPVEKLLAYFFRAWLGPWQLISIAIPIVLLFATMSWFAIEARFLREKTKLSKRREPDVPTQSFAPPPPPPAATGDAVTPYFRRSA